MHQEVRGSLGDGIIPRIQLQRAMVHTCDLQPEDDVDNIVGI